MDQGYCASGTACVQDYNSVCVCVCMVVSHIHVCMWSRASFCFTSVYETAKDIVCSTATIIWSGYTYVNILKLAKCIQSCLSWVPVCIYQNMLSRLESVRSITPGPDRCRRVPVSFFENRRSEKNNEICKKLQFCTPLKSFHLET